MSLKVGIVGLPNVGKSTLFNAITNSSVEAANYPFATINPNIGTVEIKDTRLMEAAKIFNSKKIIYQTIDFIDIAGLISGASKGEGLGNEFLKNIRETDLICHVVRCFESKIITHVEGSVNPIRDIEIINLELILSDESIVDKRIDRIKTKVKSGDKLFSYEFEILSKIKKHLSNGEPASKSNLSIEEYNVIKSLNLITLKRAIFIGNVGETDLNNDNEYYKKLVQYAKENSIPVIKICAKLEEDISILDDNEKIEFYKEYNIKESGLNHLSRVAAKNLNLSTFFTLGPQEAHAWQFKNGLVAPQCAGLIHTDFEKGFIKADIYKIDDLLNLKNEHALRQHGKIKLEGKTYIVEDGDVCFFKFNN